MTNDNVNEGDDAVVDKKKRGRPPKSEKDKAAPKRKQESVSDGDEEAPVAPPVKRGRGRPPKAGGPAKQKKPKGTGKRGRPPKNPKPAPKKADSEEEGSD